MNQDCDTCKYAGNKIPNERCSQCDRKYSNWALREEEKMEKACDTCKYKVVRKLGMGEQLLDTLEPCDNCVQHIYTNWKPKEEKKIKELEDKSGHNILKIYQFPKDFKGRTVVLYPDKKFCSWNPPIETTEALKRNDRPEPIKYWLCERFGQLAQECLDGKHEQYCVWRREEVNNNKPEPFWIVWRPGRNIVYNYNTVETAEKRAIEFAKEDSPNGILVARVESKFQLQEVVKTEYKKD